MSDNDPILLGRAMPDDLSKKISEALNRKSITPEDELQDAFEDMARDIALIEPDPMDWAGECSGRVMSRSHHKRYDVQAGELLNYVSKL
jgi:hypothetical protein